MRRGILTLGCAALAIPAAAAAIVAAAVYIDHFPARDGMEAAHSLANGQGYKTYPGGIADFVTQPDGWGGCEVRAKLLLVPADKRQELVVRVRRSWTFGSWWATGIDVQDIPDEKQKAPN